MRLGSVLEIMTKKATEKAFGKGKGNQQILGERDVHHSSSFFVKEIVERRLPKLAAYTVDFIFRCGPSISISAIH